MKLIPMAVASMGMVLGSFVAPTALSPQASACSYDYVISTKTLTATRQADEVRYLSNALLGPGTVSAQWSTSVSNAVTSSLEFGSESSKIGVSVTSGYTQSAGSSYSFPVPSGKYGKVKLVMPKWRFYNELTWSYCGTGTTYKTYAYRTHYPQNKYLALETRTSPW